MKHKNLVLGVDIGGTNTKYGIIDLNSSQLLSSTIWPTNYRNIDQFIETFDKAVSDLCFSTHMDIREIEAVGIGVPGFVKGDLISLVWETLVFLEGNHFVKVVEDSFGKPVKVDNDARVVALGEYFHGGHVQTNRLLSLTLGTGVGFGFIVDGKFQENSSINHMAGHILIRQGAEQCYCGLSGCLESLVNGQKLVSTYKELLEPAPEFPNGFSEDAKGVMQAALDQNPTATQAVEQLLDDLISGLNVYINLFAPDLFVLGGGLAKSLNPYLLIIEQGLTTSPFEGYQTKVCISQLGEYAGMFGAASLWVGSLDS